MTHKLSFAPANLDAPKEVSRVIEQSCPWCEAGLRVELRVVTDADAQTCPECLTTWWLEDEPAAEMALAA